jgi:hypothetical protein
MAEKIYVAETHDLAVREMHYVNQYNLEIENNKEYRKHYMNEAASSKMKHQKEAEQIMVPLGEKITALAQKKEELEPTYKEVNENVKKFDQTLKDNHCETKEEYDAKMQKELDDKILPLKNQAEAIVSLGEKIVENEKTFNMLEDNFVKLTDRYLEDKKFEAYTESGQHEIDRELYEKSFVLFG